MGRSLTSPLSATRRSQTFYRSVKRAFQLWSDDPDRMMASFMGLDHVRRIDPALAALGVGLTCLAALAMVV